jgi:hypothetical protein
MKVLLDVCEPRKLKNEFWVTIVRPYPRCG